MNRIPTGQSGPYCKLIFLMDALMPGGERQKIFGLAFTEDQNTPDSEERLSQERLCTKNSNVVKAFADVAYDVSAALLKRFMNTFRTHH